MPTLDFESFNKFERIIKTKKNALQLWVAVMDNLDEYLMKTAREPALLSENGWGDASLAMEAVNIAHWNTKRNVVPTGLGNLKNLRQFKLHYNRGLKGCFQYQYACYCNEFCILPKDLALCHNVKVLSLS